MTTDANCQDQHDQAADTKPALSQSREAEPAPDQPDETSNNKPATQSAFKQGFSAAQLPAETREFMESRMIAANFGNMVTVLMQSPAHKDHKLPELRALVVPALLNNQFRVAEAHKKGSGATIPVGLILWAQVSDEVDKRLSNTDEEDIKLSPPDWASGENIWIIEAVGAQRFIGPLLGNLRQKDFKGKTVKYRRKSKEGIEVMVLEMSSPADPADQLPKPE